jgi:hypothetical protein
VAAKEARRRGWAQRVLIFDWDVHHGNGTQKMFWEDDSVLCFSVHRYDRGNFYPGGPEGNNDWVGEGDGQGYNVNVPWPKSGAGDEEYRAVVNQLLRPIAQEYKPDLVLISAGFDAAQGDPLGGCHITPEGYYMMTKACKELANGKVVIALEGGYSLRATAQSMAACVSALLDPSKDVKPASTGVEGSNSAPSSPPASAGSVYLDAIEATRKIQAHFWKSVRQADDVLDYSAFRSNTPERLPRRVSKSVTVGAKGTGGWEIKRDSTTDSAQRTPLSSPATPAAPDFGESKSVGCTPSTASKNWQVRQATPPPASKVIVNDKAPAPASSPAPADSSVSTDVSSRSSSIASSPATPAGISAPRASGGTSGWRPVGRNNSVNSLGSRGSGGSARSWQDWDDSD